MTAGPNALIAAALSLAMLIGLTTGFAPGRTRHGICGDPDRRDGQLRCLADLWSAYKRNYLNFAGYVNDPSRDGGRVTSEGQSYALLQAAWVRDRETFVRVLDWTSRHLRRSDGLHSWLWDPHRGGRVVDANTATDADTDIAFALIVAARAFRESDYLRQAAQIVRAIRTSSRVQVRDRWFPSAGNWAGTDRIINLSYFAPYAYEYFELIDPGAGWTGAIDVGYGLLDMATAQPRQLPPEFAAVDTDGRLQPLPAGSQFSADFSFDAFRIPWRVEFDCRLTRRPAACEHVITDRIGDLVERNPALVDRYSSTGEPLSTTHTLSSYGSFLPGLQRRRPTLAADVQQSRLPSDVLTALSRSRTRYYDANWVWFGLALVNDFTTGRTPAKNEIAF